MKKEYIFIVFLLMVAAGLFGFGSSAGLALQRAVRGLPSGSASPDASGLTASLSGSLQNDNLTIGGVTGKKVPVYSQYPLNLKNELSIAAGSAEGVAEGDAALSGGFFVGVVEKVFDHSAIVQTIFDSRFQVPVRIGVAGADALLRGGVNPSLTLIATGASVTEGDEVYSAANGMPYGVPIGALRGLHDASDKVFREAALVAPYDPGTLDQVTVFPSSGR